MQDDTCRKARRHEEVQVSKAMRMERHREAWGGKGRHGEARGDMGLANRIGRTNEVRMLQTAEIKTSLERMRIGGY